MAGPSFLSSSANPSNTPQLLSFLSWEETIFGLINDDAFAEAIQLTLKIKDVVKQNFFLLGIVQASCKKNNLEMAAKATSYLPNDLSKHDSLKRKAFIRIIDEGLLSPVISSGLKVAVDINRYLYKDIFLNDDYRDLSELKFIAISLSVDAESWKSTVYKTIVDKCLFNKDVKSAIQVVDEIPDFLERDEERLKIIKNITPSEQNLPSAESQADKIHSNFSKAGAYRFLLQNYPLNVEETKRIQEKIDALYDPNLIGCIRISVEDEKCE